jgi:hypothetical protein
MLRRREVLNIEYYKDELVELGIIDLGMLALVQGQPSICRCGIMCDECLFDNHNFSCYDDALNWLFSEYKEEKEEKEVDWSKVKVDTPILVRDFEKAAWERRYFAGFKDGEVYAWNGGLTSWTADDEKNVCIWKYAKLAESEE